MAEQLDKWEKRHRLNTARYQRLLDDIFADAAKEAATLSSYLRDFDPNKPFSFDDYPMTRERVKALLNGLKTGVETTIASGVRSEWALSDEKNVELCRKVFGKDFDKMPDEQKKRYLSNNENARLAFARRRENGLNLSDRVWNYTNQFKSEIEMGIDLGLREGLSADEMSRSLRQYLKYADKLFRRVRDTHGLLHLSKRAENFHPGRGVYRSSYKNARRLAATETNMAYRTADYLRYQQLDFVVGIEIHLSGNHTLNGVPFTDICDDLKGRYPKDFKFTGWHPLCRCYATTVLKTEEEMAEDDRRILSGEEPMSGSANAVTDVPDNFKGWIRSNIERIDAATGRGTLPYFIKDNKAVVDEIVRIEKNRREYERLKADPNYRDVAFNPKNGGLKATHIGHNFNKDTGQYEKDVQEIGFRTGHSVILENEFSNVIGRNFTEGTWDGLQFEIAGRETGTSNNIKRGLEHCADKGKTEIAVLYFPKNNFSLDNFNEAFRRYKGLEKLGDGQFVKFKKIICIQDGKIIHEAGM